MSSVEPAFLMAPYVTLGEAGFCLDCEVVFTCRRLVCPTCGGQAWSLLKNLMKERPDPVPSRVRPNGGRRPVSVANDGR